MRAGNRKIVTAGVSGVLCIAMLFAGSLVLSVVFFAIAAANLALARELSERP